MSEASFLLVRQAAPLRVQVRELLRAQIVEMRFKPGQRLVERELCELAGVSRAVIREVLRELETDGLVRIIPNKGPVVAGPMQFEEARGIYEVRAVLEGLAGRCFVERATEEERQALRRAFDDIETVTRRQESDPHVILQAKAQFYAVLLAGARNPTATDTLRGLRDRVTLLRALTVVNPGRAAKSLEELRLIMDAIDANDAEAAWTTCLVHVQKAASVALGLLAARNRADEAAQADDAAPVARKTRRAAGSA